jgi:molecular chaperone IbpA
MGVLPKPFLLKKEKNMNAMTRFDTQALNRALVGFDRMFDTFETRFGNQLSSNYPPYNVVKKDDDHYAIEIAVAGFKKSEINVEVDGDQLTIKGQRNKDEADGVQYMHRGLSARDFVRQFTLAEYMLVQGASIQDGVIRVDLERVVPDHMKPRLIDIVEIK